MVCLILLRKPVGHLKPQPVPDEGIELFLAALTEQSLDRAPIALVELGLLVVGKRHQDVIANEVDGRERFPLGVHGLEYELCVVHARRELGVNDLHAVETRPKPCWVE